MRRRFGLAALVGMSILLSFQVVRAHATLIRSDPPANSTLAAAPTAIRLWFSETVEPAFSAFTLLDSGGKTVATPPSQVDSADHTQLVMSPGPLPKGLYTVVWHTVSAMDGHATSGSFPFAIGLSAAAPGIPAPPVERVPPEGALIRWLNLLSMSLAVGSIGFVLFVWTPSIRGKYPAIERRMSRLIWVGWGALGLTGLLMLLMQVSLAGQVSLADGLGGPALKQIISDTRYGALWVTRMALWALLGVEIFFWSTRGRRSFLWIGLLIGSAILLTNSLFSHASAVQDSTVSVASDWIHLCFTALWIGGLLQFINVFGPVRRLITPDLPALLRLVGRFSNFARVLVAGLILSGLYAAWLEVGSIDGLTTTLYGQTLLLKLLLLLPLLAVAGVNLLLTQRGLRAGQAVWAGRLRRLMMAEVLLAIEILVAVGVLTSLSPSRTVLEQRTLAAALVPANPIIASQTVNDLHIQIVITPGWVGQNTFALGLTDVQGQPVTDVSLIRIRFDDQTAEFGESELRIQPAQGSAPTGVYTVSGSNLSQAGTWRIRVSVQRPSQYDTLADFKAVLSAPPPVQISGNALPYRLPALLLMGLATSGIGGLFLARSRYLSSTTWASVALMLLGGAFLISGVSAFASTARSQPGAMAPPDSINIDVQSPLEQAAPGKTVLVIQVRDAQGNPVSKALVEVVGTMTEPGMAPSFGTARESTAGRYDLPFEWTMSGDWVLTVKVTLTNGQLSQKTFNLKVTTPHA